MHWCLSLEEFGFNIEHLPGKANVVPDTLSRVPLPVSSIKANMLYIPPAETETYLIIALSLDIPNLAETSNNYLDFIKLACNPILPLSDTNI